MPYHDQLSLISNAEIFEVSDIDKSSDDLRTIEVEAVFEHFFFETEPESIINKNNCMEHTMLKENHVNMSEIE